MNILHRKKGISRYIKLYAASPKHDSELEIGEVIQMLAEYLEMSKRQVYRYHTGDSNIPEAKVAQILDFFEGFLSEDAIDDLKELLSPTTVAVEQE